MNDPISKAAPPGSAWTAAAILGFALVGVLRRQQLATPASARTAPPPPIVRDAAPEAAKPGSDGTPTAHPPGFTGVARAVFDRFGRDNISLVAAGVAFYVMLSIFPALAAMVSLYALVGDPNDVANRIQDYRNLLPPEAMNLIITGLQSFAKTAGSTLSWALGTSVLLALWSSRNGVSSIMTGLNIAYEEVETRSFLAFTATAVLLTVGAIIFAMVVVLAVAVIPVVVAFLPFGSTLGWALSLARWPILAVLVAMGFAVIYRIGPSRPEPSWRWISWGSGIATVLWLGGSILFSVYVSRFGSYDATYGALGAVVVLLMWLWVSALVLLVGAEIDAELDQRATLTGSPLKRLPSGAPKR